MNNGRVSRWFPIWVVFPIVVMAIGTVWLRLSIIGTTYSISQADRQLANLHQENEQIELKITGLRSPRRLEVLARAKFGLSKPRTDQVVYLK